MRCDKNRREEDELEGMFGHASCCLEPEGLLWVEIVKQEVVNGRLAAPERAKECIERVFCLGEAMRSPAQAYEEDFGPRYVVTIRDWVVRLLGWRGDCAITINVSHARGWG